MKQANYQSVNQLLQDGRYVKYTIEDDVPWLIQ